MVGSRRVSLCVQASVQPVDDRRHHDEPHDADEASGQIGQWVDHLIAPASQNT